MSTYIDCRLIVVYPLKQHIKSHNRQSMWFSTVLGLRLNILHKYTVWSPVQEGDSTLSNHVFMPAGTTCDCGRYRKVVGQLDINTGKLRNAVNFAKNGESLMI